MSHKQGVTISEKAWPDSQILHEIARCRERIDSLLPKLSKRPRTQREINDFERQIADKQSVLEFRRSQAKAGGE
jgi:hypothetical protein